MKVSFFALGCLFPVVASAQILVNFEVTGTLSRVPADAVPGIGVGDPVSFSFSTEMAPTIPISSGYATTENAVSNLAFDVGVAPIVFGVSGLGTLSLLNDTGNEALGLEFDDGLNSNSISGYQVVNFKMIFLNAGIAEPGTLDEPSVRTLDAFDPDNWIIRGGTIAFQDASLDFFSVDYMVDTLSVSGDIIDPIPEPAVLNLALGAVVALGLLTRRRR